MPKSLNAVHAAADYYEPLFRARFVKAMKALRAHQTSVAHFALAMGTIRQAQAHMATGRTARQTALSTAVTKVTTDALKRGGTLGAKELNKLG